MSTIIHAYSGGRDREVANLILSIQNGEAGLSLSVEDQPDLLDIASTYRDGGFWIAVDRRHDRPSGLRMHRYPEEVLCGCVLSRSRRTGLRFAE
nr:hypothetical protein [uncultured Rhodopila sp.]